MLFPHAMIQQEEERAVFILLYLLSIESKPWSSSWKPSPRFEHLLNYELFQLDFMILFYHKWTRTG